MRIGIYTQWHVPEQGPAAVVAATARALADRGHEVHVLNRFPDYLAYVGQAEHALSAVTMPGKSPSTFSAGRPVLAAAHGDLAELVKSRGVGFTAHPGDPRSIPIAIRSELAAGNRALESMGAAARALYLNEFSALRTADQAEALLTRIAGRRRNAPRQVAPIGRQRA